MSKSTNKENSDNKDKEIFVKLLKYSTPLTVAILLYVGFIVLNAEFPMIAIIFVLIILEVIMGLKAEELYDYTNN